ncbi:Hypothetical predicted protein [Cloeon dipterum]|uniref:Uncharacterized protein n=1 Tax=Cloeon dipterum TaxID=197152 RepID=A0A8S1DT90_9INSE|nr:Hypothetical predicted protein [Cloeon dipterum]
MKSRKCSCCCHVAKRRQKHYLKDQIAQANRLLVMALIVLANLPFSLVESEALKQLLQFFAPWSKIPCRKSLCKLIDEAYLKGQQLCQGFT